jgi:hypothetical protein
MTPDYRAFCTERLPELRGMFERILCVTRNPHKRAIGNIELADRLIDAVVSWSESSLAQPEPVAPTDLDAEFRGWYVDRYGRPYFGGIALVECVEWTRFALARWGTPANNTKDEN